MWTRLSGVVLGGILYLTTAGCGKSSPAFSVEAFQQSRATTEQEAVAELGPGEEVKNSYTQSVVEAHKLPPTAKFLRWQDPSQPGMHYHIVVVDGRIVERDVWDSRKK